MTIADFLVEVRRAHGVDLTSYRYATVERCVHRRTATLGLDGPEAYLERLREDPGEVRALLDAVLVSRTAFFRDARTMRCLREVVLPDLLAALPDDRPVRVWSAGCATGEEAYSLAMMLDAALGREAFLRRVQIHGTDVDERALEVARSATYAKTRVAAIPPDLAERCLVPAAGRYAVHPDVRARVRFATADLVTDAPPVEVADLVACRNTLIYLDPPTRSDVLERLRATLSDVGRLVLGDHELLTDADGDWRVAAAGHRIYAKGRSRVAGAPGSGRDGRSDPATLARAAFETMPVAGLVVDAGLCLRLANRAARRLFELRPTDVDRTLTELWATREPRDLPQRVETVLRRPRPASVPGVRVADGDGGRRTLTLQLQPVFDGQGVCGVAASLSPAPRGTPAGPEVEEMRTQMAQIFDNLRTTVQELEATNDELNRANEELNRRPTAPRADRG